MVLLGKTKPLPWQRQVWDDSFVVVGKHDDYYDVYLPRKCEKRVDNFFISNARAGVSLEELGKQYFSI